MYTERRKERRCSNGKTRFPIKTKSGRLIDKERRRIHDRRLGDLQLELVDVEEIGLPDFLSVIRKSAV
jgi:hypothetical protein